MMEIFFKGTNELRYVLLPFKFSRFLARIFFNLKWMFLRRKFPAVISEKPGNKFIFFSLLLNLFCAKI